MSDTRESLKAVLARMDVPTARAEVRDEADIHWLGRNLAMNNPEGADLEGAREHLKALGARMIL